MDVYKNLNSQVKIMNYEEMRKRREPKKMDKNIKNMMKIIGAKNQHNTDIVENDDYEFFQWYTKSLEKKKLEKEKDEKNKIEKFLKKQRINNMKNSKIRNHEFIKIKKKIDNLKVEKKNKRKKIKKLFKIKKKKNEIIQNLLNKSKIEK